MTVLSLADAKSALRYPDPSAPHPDDPLLQMFIDAIVDVAQYHCGALDGTEYTEYHDGGSPFIDTWRRPILSVKSVRESWGVFSWSLDFQEVGTGPTLTQGGMDDNAPVASSLFAYSVDNYELGRISRRTVGNALRAFQPGTGNVEVIYSAGVADVPPAVRLGIIQGLQHVWQNSMLRATTQAAGYVQFDATSGEHYSREPQEQPIDFALPWRVIQLFRSHSRMPVIG